MHRLKTGLEFFHKLYFSFRMISRSNKKASHSSQCALWEDVRHFTYNLINFDIALVVIVVKITYDKEEDRF